MSDEVKKITVICERLGASPEQAATMARQLLKRADQLAAERGITRETALAQLLQILVEGRQGNVPPGFSPPGSKQ
ncbi:hypothetical protein ESB00_19105 [Oleiharenicola lentus]|uniref:Uncharacterized protein n=1 Tax=Oleiharenicola lentus TaxID=2508720 RepID=A0A4Q1C5R4_9BACT|nr:hypothetical protein [Oleiharenicola lentus]RXK53792.1 hypothetical protein ESB00_19105 [Oleiharenicola lentus]